MLIGACPPILCPLHASRWSPVATAKKRKGKHAKKSTGLELTAPQLWATVGKACFSHFQTRISVANGVGGFLQLGPAAEGMQVSKLALLRSVCKKTGVQLLARQYNLSNATSTPTFNTDDILDVFPLTKHMYTDVDIGLLRFFPARFRQRRRRRVTPLDIVR